VKQLPRKPTGHSKEVKFLSDIVDCLAERTPLKTDDYELDQKVNGWRIKPPRSTGGAGSLEQRMIIKEIHDDWFRCLPYDKAGQHPADADVKEADYILVAKPWELRMTDWDGQTIDGITFDYSTPDQRTATQASTGIVETHIVARPWYVGEIILAVNQVTGGTDATDDNLKDILWEDTNQASHAWAMVDINDTGGITPESLNVRSVSALAPIKSTGGTRPVISLLPSGVTPGTYGSVTVDAHGLVTDGTAGGGSSLDDPTAQVGLTAVNGVAATAMRSDAAPPIDQGITPVWTGAHEWNTGGTAIILANDNILAGRDSLGNVGNLLSFSSDNSVNFGANGFSTATNIWCESAKRIVIAASKTLTNTTAVELFEIDLALNFQAASGKIFWSIIAEDATERQIIAGTTNFAAVDKAGTITENISDTLETSAMSSGTLTAAFDILDGTDAIRVRATATSSLTPTVLKIFYEVILNAKQTFTLL
jgi:hypothetical protein